MTQPDLSRDRRRFLAAARRAVLATTDPTGRPRLVPICYVVSSDPTTGSAVLYTPLDDKPKRTTDPRRLARVRDIAARPAVSILVDRWSEDWGELAWLRVYGEALVLESGDPSSLEERSAAIEALRAKYPQYAGHDLEARPLIRIVLTDAVAWPARGW